MQKKNSMLSRPLVCGLLASFCCLLWGSAVPFLNVGYREFQIASDNTPSLILFAGARFFLAGCLTVLFTSVLRKRFARPKDGNWGLVFKLSMMQTVLQYVLFYIGVANTASVKASIIQGLLAFVNILVACYIFRSEKMNGLKWLGGLLGVAGILLVNLGGGSLGGGITLMGEGALMTSMVTNALSAGMIKIYGRREDSMTLSGWQFMLGGAVMAAAGMAMGGSLGAGSVLGCSVLLYLAFLSATAYTLWAVLLNHNPVSSVTVYTFLQPIFGVMLSLLLVASDGPVPLLRYAAALVLVSTGILVVVRGQRKAA